MNALCWKWYHNTCTHKGHNSQNPADGCTGFSKLLLIRPRVKRGDANRRRFLFSLVFCSDKHRFCQQFHLTDVSTVSFTYSIVDFICDFFLSKISIFIRLDYQCFCKVQYTTKNWLTVLKQWTILYKLVNFSSLLHNRCNLKIHAQSIDLHIMHMLHKI